jgi:hypothetical protein
MYTAVPSDEDGRVAPRPRDLLSLSHIAKTALLVAVTASVSFILGFVVRGYGIAESLPQKQPMIDGLLPPQAFIPESKSI